MSENPITMDKDWGEPGSELTGAQVQSFIKSNLIELRAKTPLTNVSWDELFAMRLSNQLIPGQLYRITDFVTTVANDPEARSAGHAFDVVVFALSGDTLAEEAMVVPHVGDTYFENCNLTAWKVWYCLDNDTDRFQWADTANGKGVIYRMIDEWGNDCPYDFKNVQFKRYHARNAQGLCEYYAVADIGSVDYDSAFYIWAYTFSAFYGEEAAQSPENIIVKDCSLNTTKVGYSNSGHCGDNTIGKYDGYYSIDNSISSQPQCLNNIVCFSGDRALSEEEVNFVQVNDIKIGQSCFNMTIGGMANHIAPNCRNIIILAGAKSNVIETGCSGVVLENCCINNHIGNEASGYFIKGSCNNIVGKKSSVTISGNDNNVGSDSDCAIKGDSNVIGRSCSECEVRGNNNSLKIGCSSIYIKGSDNQLGHYVTGKIIGNYNVVGDTSDCNISGFSNKVGYGLTGENEIDGDCNQVDSYSKNVTVHGSYNIIGGSCQTCTIDSSQHPGGNIIGTFCSDITITGTGNKIGNNGSNIKVKADSNVIGNDCASITIESTEGGGIYGNTIGANCSKCQVGGIGNTIGNDGYKVILAYGDYNVIGDSCNTIVTGGTNDSFNTIGNNCSNIILEGADNKNHYIGTACQEIMIKENTSFCEIGNGSNNIKIGAYVKNVKIGKCCKFLNIPDGDSTASMRQNLVVVDGASASTYFTPSLPNASEYTYIAMSKGAGNIVCQPLYKILGL